MSVYFVMPSEPIDSYTDYVALIALAGYPIITADEMDVHDATHTYIASWFAAQHFNYPDARARLIFWDLEWINPDFCFPGMAEKWASDAAHAAKANARYVPLGSDSRLGAPSQDKQWDISLQMWRHPYRRAMMINRIEQHGITIAPDGFGDTRHYSLQASRMLVHIHQHNIHATVAPQRFCFAAAYGLPLLTETADDLGIFKGAVLTTPYNELDRVCSMLLRPRNAYLLDEYAQHLHNLLCVEHTFIKCVEAAL